jgi:hypothetical protein
MTQASAFTDLIVPLGDFLAAAASLGVFAAALRKTDIPPPTRGRAMIGATFTFAAWYGALTYLAMRNVFLVTPQALVPALPIAVILPLMVSLPVLLRSRIFAITLDATPLSHLIGIQVLRVMGVVFLIEWALGSLPGAFALPAALGDMATGMIAAPLAFHVDRKGAHAATSIILWSALGLSDFASAMATGFLSSPGKFQMLALDQPNLIGTAYPLALIPTFGVPIFIVLHILALWKLRLEMRQASALRLFDRPA